MPGSASVALSVGLSPALDAAALLTALDRYPFGCSEQIASRALPLLYVNDLAGAAHLALDAAADQRVRDAIDRLLARQGANGSFGLWAAGGDDAWLDSTSLNSSPARASAVLPCPTPVSSSPSIGCATLSPIRRMRRRTGAQSRLCALCAGAGTGRRRSGTCAITPTPSSIRSPRRLRRRRSPPLLGMLGRPRTRRTGLRRGAGSIAPQPVLDYGRTDYGSALRDAAALVTLASEGRRPARDRLRRGGPRRSGA